MYLQGCTNSINVIYQKPARATFLLKSRLVIIIYANRPYNTANLLLPTVTHRDSTELVADYIMYEPSYHVMAPPV